MAGFHSGIPVLPFDNCGTPGKILDSFAGRPMVTDSQGRVLFGFLI